jgi:hypothetical protein
VKIVELHPAGECAREPLHEEVERLLALCVNAYNEGFEDGKDCGSTDPYRKRATYWSSSITKADLEGAAGRGEGEK